MPPPAPPLKAQISPLANMFNPEPRSPLTSSSEHNSGTDSYGKYEAGLSAAGLALSKHISTFILALQEFLLIADITRSLMFFCFFFVVLHCLQTRAVLERAICPAQRPSRLVSTWARSPVSGPFSPTQRATTPHSSALRTATLSPCSFRKRRTAGCMESWRRTSSES